MNKGDGKLGFGVNEDIRLDTPEDMIFVRALVHLLQEEPDKARSIVRTLSPKDRAVLSFHLSELSRLVLEEDEFRTTTDRRRARLTASGQLPDISQEG